MSYNNKAMKLHAHGVRISRKMLGKNFSQSFCASFLHNYVWK